MSKSIALALMCDQNKRDLDPSMPLLVLRENSPDFLCMNAMHRSSFYLFLASNPGMLRERQKKFDQQLGDVSSKDSTCVRKITTDAS